MTCTKTGCHVYLECRNEFLYGDAYEVRDVAIFRIVGRSKDPFQKRIHYRVKDFIHWFDEEASISLLVAEDFTWCRQLAADVSASQGKLKI